MKLCVRKPYEWDAVIFPFTSMNIAPLFVFKNAVLPVLEEYTNYVYSPDLILNDLIGELVSTYQANLTNIGNTLNQYYYNTYTTIDSTTAIPVSFIPEISYQFKTNLNSPYFDEFTHKSYEYSTNSDLPKFDFSDEELGVLRRLVMLKVFEVAKKRTLKQLFGFMCKDRVVSEFYVMTSPIDFTVAYPDANSFSYGSSIVTINDIFASYNLSWLFQKQVAVDVVVDDMIYRIWNNTYRQLDEQKFDMISKRHMHDEFAHCELPTVLQYENNGHMVLQMFYSYKNGEEFLYDTPKSNSKPNSKQE